MIMDITKELKQLKVGKVLNDVDMRLYTTFKAGGIALAMVFPDSVEDIVKLMTFLKNNRIKNKVIGNGSNLIFSDLGYDGVLINLKEMNKITIDDIIIKVEAGCNLTKLALRTAKKGLTGLEFAAGIPGTVGGAVFMNAGAYKSDMGYVVSEIKVLTPELDIKTIYNKNLDFHYRSSFLSKNPGYICIEATIVLKHGDEKEIMDIIEDRKQRRWMSQPLEFPSAGSVFRNPEGDFAGRLVELNGWKGRNIGDAYVSDKHANFIINKGRASGSDIRTLIAEIQKDVYNKSGIELKTEQEFVD